MICLACAARATFRAVPGQTANAFAVLLALSPGARAGDLAQDARIELYRRVDRACRDGSLGALRAFAAAGVNLDPPNVKHFTHLATAADAGRAEVVRFLLERGADPNRHGAFGPRPLCTALRKSHAEVERLLVAAGASCAQPCLGRDGNPLPRPRDCPNSVPPHALRLVDLETDRESGDSWSTPDHGIRLWISADERFELDASGDLSSGVAARTWTGRIDDAAMPSLQLAAERKTTWSMSARADGNRSVPTEAASSDVFDVRAVDDASLKLPFAGAELTLRRR